MSDAPTKEHVKEWKNSKRWNPFNSYKLLAHVETWREIKRGKAIPAPILVTVDTSNVCNLKCAWCNAEAVMAKRHKFLSEKALIGIADFLPQWSIAQYPDKKGVQAVCIAGGGEPLLNPAFGTFVDRLVANGIEVGVVTNGILIDKYIDALSHCTWVGVSVDSASNKTFSDYKGMPADAKTYEKIMSNIEKLVTYAKKHNNKLGWSHPAYGVSYKYLLYKNNVNEIYDAALNAKRAGCKNIHYRPAGTTWDKLGTDKEIRFTETEVETFKAQIAQAHALDDASFGVYGVTHKFNEQMTRCNSFESCHAVFMTAVFEPPAEEDDPDSFILGLCCDRRGDDSLELLKNCTKPQEISAAWGSTKHWDIHDRIDIQKECPRCTYQPHNEIYEQVILNDSMTHKFI